jgi:hypothetical protein
MSVLVVFPGHVIFGYFASSDLTLIRIRWQVSASVIRTSRHFWPTNKPQNLVQEF